MHVWITVDKRNNLLATNKTPKSLQATRAFVDRKKSYDPNKWDGIIPEDWKYNIPYMYSPLGAEKPKSDDNSNEKDKKDKDEKSKDNKENKNKINNTNNGQ